MGIKRMASEDKTGLSIQNAHKFISLAYGLIIMNQV